MSKKAVKSKPVKLKPVRIHIPIEPGRNGLIRYMAKGTAIPKPERLFQYDALALLIVDEGNCTYLVDKKRIDCPRGSMIWWFPDHQRTLYARSPDLSLWVIEFSLEFLEFACTEDHDRILKHSHPGGVFLRQIPLAEHRFIRTILKRLLEGNPSAGNDYFNAGLHYILSHCWEVFLTIGTLIDYETVHPAVAKVVHFIRNEGDVESSVADLADKAGLCSSRLILLFQEQMGITITDFRNRQKLERFLDIYHHNGRLNMLGAALDAGFGSYAQFYRVFKETMKQSPREYFVDPAISSESRT